MRMSVRRLDHIPGFSIDRVAAAAGDDPEVLRLENLDTDLPPPAVAVEATRAAIGSSESNSYLPFHGKVDLRMAVAQRLCKQTRHDYTADEIVITCGATEGMLDVLLAITDPGDEVILTDPTYAGMINRVRLVGAVPRFAPFSVTNNEWRLDLDELRAAVSPRSGALFLMNPSMPTGAVLNRAEWEAVAEICRDRRLWLIYNAAMERILFDDRAYVHPATLPGMRDRTITIGSISKEYRMIGWRVGWIAGPKAIMGDICRAHIYNVVTPPGIAQAGAEAALQASPEELVPVITEWQRRRDTVLEQLRGYAVKPAAGGWSLLLDVGEMGLDSATASNQMLKHGKIAATPMKGWGEVNSDQFVRLVFSKEPVQRLSELRQRMQLAF
jgi:aspartate/methionine/tyrosine aminotransferase